MFEQLLQRPHHLARHRTEPYSKERQLYLSHLIAEGRARNTLKQVACLLLSVARYVSIDRDDVTMKEIEAAAERWLSSPHHKYSSIRSRRGAKTAFIFHASKWLRVLGRLQHPLAQSRFASELEAFLLFQRDERGLAPSTVSRRQKHVQQFLISVAPHAKTLKRLSTADISQYVRCAVTRGWARSTIALHIDSLRAFFRFSECKKWCTPGLAETIDSPRVYRHEHLPRGPQWVDVQRLVAASKGCTPTDIRDRAMLLLCAVYGLRNSEVRLLRLEDLDWVQETILVARSKQRKSQLYPLVQEVGMATLRYLREIRPRTDRRELFLSMKQPYRAITASGMYSMVRRRQRKLGITLSRYGPHSLRHACATHLLDQGLSLKEIGDHLGHMSTEATQIYAKVDLAALREVAEMDLQGFIAAEEAATQKSASRAPTRMRSAAISQKGGQQ